jgi:hypothetical protein
MKKWFVILCFLFSAGITSFAQNDQQDQEGAKIVSRMNEYIQRKLGLSKNEAEKFSPVFFRYFRDFAQTHRENRTDKLILQQKIIDLRLRYRNEFRQILDDDRANKVYKFEDQFRQEAIRIIKENRQDRLPPRKSKSFIP